MAKKNGNGGSNGDGGAPAEASAAEVQTAAEPPPEPDAVNATPAADIPPDAQVSRGLSAMTIDELIVEQGKAHAAVTENERRLSDSIFAERLIEHERCLKYQARAKEQGRRRAIILLDGKRMAVKKRNGSELLQLVSAEAEEAIQA